MITEIYKVQHVNKGFGPHVHGIPVIKAVTVREGSNFELGQEVFLVDPEVTADAMPTVYGYLLVGDGERRYITNPFFNVQTIAA